MNKVFLKIAFLLILLPTQSLWAQKMGFVAGFGQLSLDADAVGTTMPTTSSDGGYQFGTLFYSNLNTQLGGRVGVLFTERDFSVSVGNTKTAVKLSYLQVPLTLTYAFNPNLAVFGGGDLNLNVSKSCTTTGTSSCTVSGLKSADFGLTAGLTLTFMDSFGAEIFYERPLSRMIDQTSNAAVVGINLLYIIE